jgi:hypothetical protein
LRSKRRQRNLLCGRHRLAQGAPSLSNFVFERRAIQAALGRLVSVLSTAQLVDLVKRLNRAGEDRLPAMWEVMVLDAFGAVGELRHEAPLSNDRRPDIALTLPIDPLGRTAEIVGDIRTVSDRGLDEQNPVDVLGRELARLVRKAGLNGNRFGWRVEGSRQGSYRDGRMRLHLPAAPRLVEIMRLEVAPWLATIADAPDQPAALEYKSPEAEFKLT